MSGESGITDEAAIEGHDLIHNAEVEEQRAHGDQAMTTPDDEGVYSAPTGDPFGSTQPGGKSTSTGGTYGSAQRGDTSTSTGDQYGSTQAGDTSTSTDTGTSGLKQDPKQGHTQGQGRGHGGHSTMEKVKEALHMKK